MKILRLVITVPRLVKILSNFIKIVFTDVSKGIGRGNFKIFGLRNSYSCEQNEQKNALDFFTDLNKEIQFSNS